MSGSFDIDVSAGGGGGADEEDFDPVYEFLNGKYTGQAGMPPVDLNRPSFGTDFSGKGYGGGGIRGMNFGGDWATSMIGRGFSPDNFGLPGNVSDYAPGGKYNFSNTNTSVPGGYDSTGYTVGDDRVEVWGKQRDPMDAYQRDASMGMDMGMDMGIGSLSPTTPSPFESQTGIFGGTFGPRLKNAIPPKLREFLGNVASVNPATMNAAFVFKMIKGYQGAKDKGAFLKKIGTGLAMRKMMGNFGLNRTQKALVGTGMNVAQGEQNWQQGVGSLATNAGFSAMMKNLGPRAYQAGGMPAVYALMSAAKMARRRMQQGVRSGLAGPGGGG